MTDSVATQTVGTRDPRIVIEYCKQCRWMLRAAWYAQELLTTFQDQIGEVALQPSSGGRFFVTLQMNGRSTLIWDRKAEGGFPESKQLKQLIRNHIDPTKDLGHSDTPVNQTPHSKKGDTMSRAKNVVQASEEMDGPVNTLDDKPMDNTTTAYAKSQETEKLPDGPVSTLDDAPAGEPEGQGRKGRQDITKEAKSLDCQDCE